MPSHHEPLISFVPDWVTRRVAREPRAELEPRLDRFEGAALFADISGFTPLAETLARRGPEGAEELSRILNLYFGRIIDLIVSHGGDVVKFAGDALLAMWPAEGPDRGLRDQTQRTARCAVAIREALDGREVAPGVNLFIKQGVGVGEISGLHVGGVFGRWEFLLTGSALSQVTAAEAHARPGDVVLSSEAWALVEPHGVGAEVAPGAVRLEGLAAGATSGAPVPLPELGPEALAALRPYVPRAVVDRLSAGQGGWLAELRRVTVLFVNVEGLEARGSQVLEHAQALLVAMQTALYRHEGSLRQLIVDDKGTVLIAAFGLPPLTHENDAALGVQAAEALMEALGELGLKGAIGVTTGTTFCGPVGSPRRREYAMIGDMVNLSARLMKAAGEGILCDEATRRAAEPQQGFEALPAVRVKGKADPIPVYRPRRALPTPVTPSTPLVGRVGERRRLQRRLEALARGRRGGAVIVEGEAGIGKSRLVEEAVDRAEALGLKTLTGRGDPIHRRASYHPWRPVFAALLDLDHAKHGPAEQREHILGRLGGPETEMGRLAPLLGAVLPLELSDSEATRHMAGPSRAENTRRLLVDVLGSAATRSPRMILLEDAQWFDSASWKLVLAVARGLDSVLLLLSTRPLAGDAAQELGRLVEEPGVELLSLGGFTNDDIRSIVQARLGVTELERAVGDFVQEKAQGNPYFAEELALALHETGVVETADGRCRFAPGARGGRDLHLPGTVQGVVTSRVDRLPPLEQLTLKTASVIGRRFPFRTLSAVYPVEAERPELPGALGRLEALGMTPRLPDEADLTHVFRHVVTRDVVYGLMLSEQRRGLHRAVADWLEATRGDDLAPLYAALAHHWKEAGEAAKALEYLDLAAGRAVRDCASTEAVELLTEVMELADRAAVDGDPLRRARWARWLGESFEGLGKMDEARTHCERALGLLGFPRPSSSLGFVLASALALGRQALHRLFPARFLDRHRGSRSRLEAGRLHEKLTEIEFLQDRTAPIVHATVCALNLAESVGSPPEMARTYASFGIAAGCSPLRGLAEGYFARAREAVSRQSDPNSEMWTLTAEAFYCLGVGHWRRARERLDRAQELAGQVQNRWRELEAVGMLGDGAFLQADLEAAERAFAELRGKAAATSNVHLQAWGLAGRAAVALRRGRHGEAVEGLETALELLTAAGDLTPTLQAKGVLAVAYLRGDDPESAWNVARAMAEVLARTSEPKGFILLEAYSGTAEVCARLLEDPGRLARLPVSRDEILKTFRTVLGALRVFTRSFPVGEPRQLLWEGTARWNAGRTEPARRAWRRGLEAAGRLGMPYDEARLHLEMGLHLPGPERHEHLERARDRLAALGAAGEASLAEQALSGISGAAATRG